MYRMVLKHDVGAQAPGFTLKDPDGRDVSLESFREKENVLLIFFIGGFDRDAVRNLRAIAERYQRIRESDTEVLVITPELPGKLKTLAGSLNPPYPMLSDPDLKVVKEYDIYNPDTNWTWPAAFIIDRAGIIQYAFRGASPPNTPPVDYILLKLTQMKQGKAPTAAGRART
jgi:peroxiredoxin